VGGDRERERERERERYPRVLALTTGSPRENLLGSREHTASGRIPKAKFHSSNAIKGKLMELKSHSFTHTSSMPRIRKAFVQVPEMPSTKTVFLTENVF
jgi:hypothetical protein